jgi:hypothetical protein
MQLSLHTSIFSYSIPRAESIFWLVHIFWHLMIYMKDITDQIQELIITVDRECELWLNGHKTSREREDAYCRVFMQRLFWSFKDVKKLLNLRCRRILRVFSKLWSYSIKHLIHHIATCAMIVFHYWCSLMNQLAVMNPYLIVWHETDHAKVQWQRPLVITNRVFIFATWTLHATIVH